jgi:hypothetical protein
VKRISKFVENGFRQITRLFRTTAARLLASLNDTLLPLNFVWKTPISREKSGIMSFSNLLPPQLVGKLVYKKV